MIELLLEHRASTELRTSAGRFSLSRLEGRGEYGRVFHSFQRLPAFHRLAHSPGIVGVAAKVFGEPAFAHPHAPFYFRRLSRAAGFVPSEALAFVYPDDGAAASGARSFRSLDEARERDAPERARNEE